MEAWMRTLSPSRYNFAVHGGGGVVALFNASTGSIIRLEGPHACLLADMLLDPNVAFTNTLRNSARAQRVMCPAVPLAPGYCHKSRIPVRSVSPAEIR